MGKRGDKSTIELDFAFLLIILSLAIFVSAGVFQDLTKTNFDNGSYNLVFYNSSGFVQLNNSYLSGSYTSRVFDAGMNSKLNNLSSFINISTKSNLYVLDNNRAVFKSTNFGTSWSQVSSQYYNQDCYGMTANSSGALFIASKDKKVFSSVNSGVNWNEINSSAFSEEPRGIISDNNNNLYAIVKNKIIYKSANSGVTWSLINSSYSTQNNDNQYCIAYYNGNLYVLDNNRAVFKSTNFGTSWSQVSSQYYNQDCYGMTANSSGALFIASKDKKVFSSVNSGVNWNEINSSAFSEEPRGIISDNNNNLYAIVKNKIIYKSANSGVTWSLINSSYSTQNNNNQYCIASQIMNSNLTIQIRNCSLPDCSDGSFISYNLGIINLTGRYFQYKISFSREDISLNPKLYNVSLDYTVLNSAPTLVLILPQNNANYGYNSSINLNFSVSDADNNLDKCWYNINNGNNVSLTDCQNTSFNVSGNGNYVLNLYANDSLGLITKKNVSFNVSVGAPIVVLYSPIDVYLNYRNITFSYAPSDIDLSICELWGNFDGTFKLNQTNYSPMNGWINYFYLNLSDGNYSWNIRCNDSQGHSAFNGNKSFYVDTVSPNLSISEPVGKKTNRTGISISFSVSDNNLNNCWYNVYRGVNLEIQNTTIDCNGYGSFNVTIDADFVVNLYANDSAGNVNSASSSFSVDTSVPSTLSSGGSSGGGSSGGSGGGLLPLKKGELEVSGTGDIIARKGDKKTLSINAINTGKIFLNNCKLIFNGEISSWLYSNQIEGVAPGENKEFIISLNVPESIEEKDYSGEFEVKCNEISKNGNIKITIPASSAGIEIKEVKQEENGLTIIYFLKNKENIDIWLNDKDGKEIKRIKDNGEGERNVLMELPENLIGVYSIYFAPSSDLNNFLKQSVVLGKSSTTGFAILDEPGNKLIGYIVFVLIIFAAVFFIVRNKNQDIHKIKHRTLLSRKRF